MKAVVMATNLALDYVIVPGQTDKYGRTPIKNYWLGLGSKGGNVFRALNTLSQNTALIGLRGQGEIGKIIDEILKTTATARTLNFLIPDSRINIVIPPNQLLSAPNPSISKKAKTKLAELVELIGRDGDILVITGSPPQGISHTDLLTWIQTHKWSQVIVDQKGNYLVNLAKHYPNAIFKINHREYEDIMDLNLPQVIVTLGSGGAIMLKNGKPVIKIEIPTAIHEINPVGAGDVFTASLVSSMLQGERLGEEALLTAVARAAASVEQLGVSIWDEERAREIKEQLILHRVF